MPRLARISRRVGAGKRAVGGLGDDDLVAPRRKRLDDLRGVLVLRQQNVVEAGLLLAERAVGAVLFVAGNPGEDAFDAARAEAAPAARRCWGSRSASAGRRRASSHHNAAARASVARRAAIQPLQIDVLHVDDEQRRRRGIELRGPPARRPSRNRRSGFWSSTTSAARPFPSAVTAEETEQRRIIGGGLLVKGVWLELGNTTSSAWADAASCARRRPA